MATFFTNPREKLYVISFPVYGWEVGTKKSAVWIVGPEWDYVQACGGYVADSMRGSGDAWSHVSSDDDDDAPPSKGKGSGGASVTSEEDEAQIQLEEHLEKRRERKQLRSMRSGKRRN